MEETANGASSQRLHEADLENHLENPKDGANGKGSAKPAAAKAKPATPKDENEEATDTPTRELASKKDYQFVQALNLLKGMQIIQARP